MTNLDLRAADSLPVIRRLSPVVIIAAVLALVFIASATLIATLFAPKGHDTAVVTAFVVGTIAPTIVGLLALVRGDHAVQVGEANAVRLADTATQVQQVADDVNGHLQRHDTLAQTVANVAETVAAAAGVSIPPVRDPELRTRADDPPRIPPPAYPGGATDEAPLADQT